MIKTAEDTTNGYAKLSHSVQHTIMMLAAQFLLGMAINLIGSPSEVEGGSKIATTIFTALHVLIAFGLVASAVTTIRLAKKLARELSRLANIAASVVGITFVAGVATMITKNNWWSYLMAVGFIVSLLIYGAIFVRSKDV